MDQTSSCIAGLNVLNMRYVRTTSGNQGISQIEVIFILLVVTILGMVTALGMVTVPIMVTILLIVNILVYWSHQYQFAISYNTVRYRQRRWVTIYWGSMLPKNIVSLKFMINRERDFWFLKKLFIAHHIFSNFFLKFFSAFCIQSPFCTQSAH